MPRHSKLIALLAGLLGAAGCSEILQYDRPLDRLYAAAPMLGLFGHTPCDSRSKEPRGGDDCYRFDAPEKIRGVWHVEEEGSEFFEGANALPVKAPYPPAGSWLDADIEPVPGAWDTPLPWEGRAYVIEFIGRRTSYPGEHGHFGKYRNLIIMDRLVSGRPATIPEGYVRPPPKVVGLDQSEMPGSAGN